MQNEPSLSQENIFTTSQENPQLIYAWKAPLRPYKKRSPIIIRFYLSVALILSVTLYFFGDRVLLLPIWALLFLFYILTITPPMEVENRITKFGIEAMSVTIRWENISYFYFSKRFNYSILTIVSHPPYNIHTYLVIPDDEIKKHVMSILSEHTIYVAQPKKGLVERIVDALSALVPDDEDSINPERGEKQLSEVSHEPQTVSPTVVLPRPSI